MLRILLVIVLISSFISVLHCFISFRLSDQPRKPSQIYQALNKNVYLHTDHQAIYGSSPNVLNCNIYNESDVEGFDHTKCASIRITTASPNEEGHLEFNGLSEKKTAGVYK